MGINLKQVEERVACVLVFILEGDEMGDRAEKC